MSSPAFTTALEGSALALRRAAVGFWTSMRTRHRDITTSVAISASVHATLLLVVGTAMYESGDDDTNVPELSVQLETRAGPSSEESTDAALPKPVPAPVEEVLDDPGTHAETTDAPMTADAVPRTEVAPPVERTADPSAHETLEANALSAGNVITTTSESTDQVPIVEAPIEAPAPIPQTEQQMLEKNVQQVAQKLLDSNLTRSELTWQQDGQQYSARVMRQPAPDSTGLEQVIAEIMTSKDGKRMKTHLSLKRLAFSHFTQLVNTWDKNIQLHDDVIDGRFHSNTEISLTARGGVEPRFFGKVTTAAANMTFDEFGSRKRDRDIFRGGVETKTERVTLPRDMPDVVNGGERADRNVFDGDTRVIFNADGSYVWRAANGEGELQRAEPSDRPRYLIGSSGAKLYVRGTVSGIFTVYSQGDIEIEDDIVYAQDPRQVLISRDFLALIAGRDIRIADTRVTGVGDLHVNAALFAHRKFAVESAESGKPAVLYILGSLTAGTLTETEPRYATKLDYDKRFEYLRPASFPMTRRYEVDSWDQDWQEVEKGDAPPATGSLAQSQ